MANLNVVECDVVKVDGMHLAKKLRSYSIAIGASSTTAATAVAKGTRFLRFTAGALCHVAIGGAATTAGILVSDSHVDYYLDGNFGKQDSFPTISVIQA